MTDQIQLPIGNQKVVINQDPPKLRPQAHDALEEGRSGWPE